jgi:hypothetical protein
MSKNKVFIGLLGLAVNSEFKYLARNLVAKWIGEPSAEQDDPMPLR